MHRVPFYLHVGQAGIVLDDYIYDVFHVRSGTQRPGMLTGTLGSPLFPGSLTTVTAITAPYISRSSWSASALKIHSCFCMGKVVVWYEINQSLHRINAWRL
jgi:hypothetical protein